MLLCMAAIPQAAFLYQQFPLLLVPQTRREIDACRRIVGGCPLAPTGFHFDPRTP